MNDNKTFHSLNNNISNDTVGRYRRAIQLDKIGYDYNTIQPMIITSVNDSNVTIDSKNNEMIYDNNNSLTENSINELPLIYTQDSYLQIGENSLTTAVTISSDYNIKNVNLINKRRAQDTLILAQLKSGILPENFIKNSLNSEFLVVDLSHYGIGNENGKCLSKSLNKLTKLGTLCLYDNRLDSISLSMIIDSLSLISLKSLYHLDLSFNKLHNIGCKSLANYIKNGCNLKYINLSKCYLDSLDFNELMNAMYESTINSKNIINELIIKDNSINSFGMNSLLKYSSLSNCSLISLNLSWNQIDAIGAEIISEAITKNVSLHKLELSSNSFQDKGTQRIAASLAFNQTLHEIHLKANNISSKSCFIFAKVSDFILNYFSIYSIRLLSFVVFECINVN